MHGLLLKTTLLGMIAAFAIGIVYLRRGSLPTLPNLSEFPSAVKHTVQNIDTGQLVQNINSTLDSLVTNPDKNSPVVLGVKVTNESLSTVVDVIHKLPPDQINQLKNALCSPASPSAR